MKGAKLREKDGEDREVNRAQFTQGSVFLPKMLKLDGKAIKSH